MSMASEAPSISLGIEKSQNEGEYVSSANIIPDIDDAYLSSISELKSRLPYELSIATVCLFNDGDIKKRLDCVKSSGFDQVEIMPPDIEQTSPREVYEYCQQLGLQISIYQPFRDLEGTDPVDFDAKLAEFDQFLDVARELHTDLILLCASCKEDAFYDKEIYLEQLRRAADVASQKGIRIAYEALAWSTHINTLEQLVEFVKDVDRGNFGICLDSFHIFSKECNLDVIDHHLKNKVFFVQLSDAPLLKLPSLLTYSRNYRCFPTQGEFPNSQLLKRIENLNYQGPLSLEVFNESFRQLMNNKAISDDAFRSLMLVQSNLIGALPDPVRLKGVFTSSEATVTPDQLANIDVLVSDKSQYASRVGMLGYFSNSVSIREDASSLPLKKLTVVCKDRFEFNRFILYVQCVLGIKLLRKGAQNYFNTFGLPLHLCFGNSDGDELIISVATQG